MSKEKFILVSLKESESKKLAQVIANDTARKVLDYLAEKEATESELAEKLGVPISTIHYNLQALVKGKLVEADQFHYSEKGKEVLHYRLANKYIIIAPKSTYGIKEKLKNILPVALIAAVGALAIEWFNRFSFMGTSTFSKQISEAAPMVAEESARAAADTVMTTAAPEAARAATDTVVTAAAKEGAKVAVESSANTVAGTASGVLEGEPNLALWFLFGCIFTLAVILVVDWLRNRNK
ncbi:MAG: helix-turn-helix domain-containing protein [Nanoarchaeota archaeon]|nr:helix-turn-helix domain-containing protein [Nanoarchaeota archaeon]MBU1704584.1 helix-turn-helix domain-containing protein [Nanoarchaeota archaeon]